MLEHPITMVKLNPFSFSGLDSFGIHIGTRHLDGKSWDPYAPQSKCDGIMNLQSAVGQGYVVCCERCNLTLYGRHVQAQLLWALMTIQSKAAEDTSVLNDSEQFKFLPHRGQKTTLDLMGERQDYLIWEKSWDHNVAVLFPLDWPADKATISKIAVAGLYLTKILAHSHSLAIEEGARRAQEKFSWLYNL